VPIALRLVPDGVSAHQVDVVPMFLVRHGNAITGFLNGLPPRRTFVVCGDAFVDQTGGGRWDLAGRPSNSTAERDLDQVAADVVGGRVRVFPQRITQPAGERTPPFIPRLPPGWERTALSPTNC